MLVTTSEDLITLCQTLRLGDYVAVDTEFMREKTYYARLCLIQVANDEVVASIDPLALKDLGPLWTVLFDPGITKVLHAGRQDLEIIRDLTGRLPGPLFDTQIAATVAGYEDSISYGRLVEAITGERLDKTLTRTDWSRRPLDPAQIRYAEDDVRYLRLVYKHLRQELIDTGRLDWVRGDFERLGDPGLYTVEPREMFRKIKKGQLLRPRQLAVLRELAAWRETTAMQRDKPRKWILDDDLLFEIARQTPTSVAQLTRMRGISEAALQQWGEAIIAAVERGLAVPEAERPQWHERRKLKPGDLALVDLLQALVRQRGLEHGVAPQLLAGRPDLEAVVAEDPEAAVLSGWRAKLVGDELQALLAGRLAVRVEEGHLVVEPVARGGGGGLG
ncbi:MAG: ribonuclease D [Pseudomonadota bacterium]